MADEDKPTDDSEPINSVTKKPARRERVPEMLAGGASLALLATLSLFWAFVQSADFGRTVKKAVLAEMGISITGLAFACLGLGSTIYGVRRDRDVNPWYGNAAQLITFCLVSIVAGGVAPSISLVSVYQTAQGDPQLQNITILAWFTWLWTLGWLALRLWNDNNITSAAQLAITQISGGEGRGPNDDEDETAGLLKGENTANTGVVHRRLAGMRLM